VPSAVQIATMYVYRARACSLKEYFALAIRGTGATNREVGYIYMDVPVALDPSALLAGAARGGGVCSSQTTTTTKQPYACACMYACPPWWRGGLLE